MAMKPRVLCLMRYLEQNSDEQHPVTTAEIRRYLASVGCPVTIITLRTDIASLIAAGYGIAINEREGLSTTYSWIHRELSVPELRILVDAVSSCQFLTVEKSRELIRKLVSLAGPSSRAGLTPRILVSEHVKAPNRQILLSVQAIHRAMERDRRITFRYVQYNLEKEQVPRHAGTPEEEYVVSPYAMVWNNDRYYLVGYSDRRKAVSTYRIDRMIRVRQAQKKRVPEPEGFHVQDYTDKVFWMYDGDEENVTLRCERHLMDQVIDKFGEGIRVRKADGDFFEVTVPVRVSGTFYAWVTQFIGEMTLIGPEHVRKAYAGYLRKGIENTLAE